MTVIIANNANVDYEVDEILPLVYKLACVRSRGRDDKSRSEIFVGELYRSASELRTHSAVHFYFTRVVFQK